MHPQLTLSLESASTASIENFYISESNAIAIAAVTAVATDQSDDSQIFVHGQAGSGKTHLAMAACALASEAGYRAAYLPSELLVQPEALAGLEQYQCVCVDQFDLIEAHVETDWFHCINRCREAKTRLLFFSRKTVDELQLALPDLRTRLSWGATYKLSPLTESELAPALMQIMNSRGLTASTEVVQYILKRQSRDIATLTTLVRKIEQQTLTLGRALTIPLVREIID